MSKAGFNSKPFTLGRTAFAKISAVEGIHLSEKMERQFSEFDRQGLSADQRRAVLVRRFGKE